MSSNEILMLFSFWKFSELELHVLYVQ